MGRPRTSRPDTRPPRLLPQAVRTHLYNHRAAGFRLFQSQLKVPIPSPAPRPAPRTFSARVTFALQTFRPALCLPCWVRPRPLSGQANRRRGLEPLGGPAANAHAVGGLRAGIGGEATALCPHSGRADLGGPWGTPGAKMASAAEGDVGTVAELARVLRWGFEELSLNKLATSLGASEQALRLIISIFMGKDPPASLRPLAESPGNRDVTSPTFRSHPGGLSGVRMWILNHANQLSKGRQVFSRFWGCRALRTSSPFTSTPFQKDPFWPLIWSHHRLIMPRSTPCPHDLSLFVPLLSSTLCPCVLLSVININSHTCALLVVGKGPLT